jgi:hypothetical protein
MTQIFKNQQNDTIRADVAPDDSWIEIDEAEFSALCESKRVQPDPSAIIEAKKQAVRVLREQVLDRLAGIAGRAQRKGDTELAAACDIASEALLDITKDLPTDPDAVELDLFNRYQAIAYNAISAAPSLATAFAQVDA